MKLGVLSATLQEQPLEEALQTIAALGADAVDFSTGGYGTKAHCDPQALLSDQAALAAFRGAVADRGLSIGALCCYGNPLHPDRDMALAHRRDLRDTILLAELLGLHRIVALAGCPGDSPQARFPNWVVYPWPPELTELRQWQWEHQVLPFWASEAAFAVEHGVTSIALEMHAANVVYNPETLLALRRLIGDAIGACLNPAHLYWQGIDMVHAIRALGGAIAYVHAGDCQLDPLTAPTNGLLDGKPFYYERERSWSFRTVGYGHGPGDWRDIVLALRLAGYDDVIAIAQEDTMLLPADALRKAVEFLRQAVVRQPLAVPEPPQPVP